MGHDMNYDIEPVLAVLCRLLGVARGENAHTVASLPEDVCAIDELCAWAGQALEAAPAGQLHDAVAGVVSWCRDGLPCPGVVGKIEQIIRIAKSQTGRRTVTGKGRGL